jgi:hypothetical protein
MNIHKLLPGSRAAAMAERLTEYQRLADCAAERLTRIDELHDKISTHQKVVGMLM